MTQTTIPRTPIRLAIALALAPTVSVLSHTAAVMTRLLLSAVALAVCLLAMSPVSLAGIVLSNVTFSACPGREQLPVTAVDATDMVVSAATVHVIGHLVSSIKISSAFCLVNSTQTANGQTVTSSRVSDLQDSLVNPLPISAGSDVFIESFTYFSPDSLPLQLATSYQIYDATLQEIHCELHGVTISYQQDEGTASDGNAVVAARALPVANQPSSAPAPLSTSSYTVTVHQWSNCRASDPVQVVSFGVYISVNQALTESMVISTAADISSGLMVVNGTNTVLNGPSYIDYSTSALSRWAVNNQPLPWLAGSWLCRWP